MLKPWRDEDKVEVKAMIEKHFKYTGSDPAEWILGNWDVASELFVKVMPKDYKAVLQKAKGCQSKSMMKSGYELRNNKSIINRLELNSV